MAESYVCEVCNEHADQKSSEGQWLCDRHVPINVTTGFFVYCGPSGHWQVSLDLDSQFRAERNPTPADVIPATATILEEQKAVLVAGMIEQKSIHFHR